MNLCNADGLTISKVESMPCCNYEIPTCKNSLVIVQLITTTSQLTTADRNKS